MWIRTRKNLTVAPSKEGMRVPMMDARVAYCAENHRVTSMQMNICGVVTGVSMCTKTMTIIDNRISIVLDAGHYDRGVADMALLARVGHDPKESDSVYTLAMPYGEERARAFLREYIDRNVIQGNVTDAAIDAIVQSLKVVRHAGPVLLSGRMMRTESVPETLRASWEKKVRASIATTVAYNRWRRFVVRRKFHPYRLLRDGIFDEWAQDESMYAR